MQGERNQRLPDPKKIAGMVRESLGYLGRRGSAAHAGPPGARDVTNAAGTAHLADAHALAIGVSRYSHIRPLPDVQDASDVAAALTDPALAGCPPANARTLLDAEATRAAILAELEQLVKRTTADSTVLYFSGHGGRIERDGREISQAGDHSAELAALPRRRMAFRAR